MQNLKEIALHRIAFELLTEFKKWDGCKDFKKETDQIEQFLNTLHKKLNKEYRSILKNNKNQLDYVMSILLHLTRILTYYQVMPSKEQYNKIKEGALVDEVESVKMLTDILIETNGVEHLLSINPVESRYKDHNELYLELLENYHLDQYVILTNIISALGFTIEGKKSKKDMSIIIEHNLHDLCNICGFMEAWKLRPMKTIRFLNKQIRTKDERMRNLQPTKKEVRVYNFAKRSNTTSLPTLRQEVRERTKKMVQMV